MKALALALLLAGCATEFRYVAVPQELIPAPAVLPKVMAGELGCLSDQAYVRLVERERALKYEIMQWRALAGDSR